MGILDELGWRELIAQSTDLDALGAELPVEPLSGRQHAVERINLRHQE